MGKEPEEILRWRDEEVIRGKRRLISSLIVTEGLLTQIKDKLILV